MRSLRQMLDTFQYIRHSKGVRRAASNLKAEVRLALRHGASLSEASRYDGQRGLQLHIGCGPNLKPGWVNIDFNRQADLQLDMREPFPLPDASCAIVYSEHFFEHLGYPTDATNFLKESYRVLQPGGRFSVGVPDTEVTLLAYAGAGHPEYFSVMKSEKYHPERCVTKAEHVDYHFRQDGEHHFAYDFETMEKCLASVGFTKIARRKFDPAIDAAWRETYTLYVDAEKP